MQPEQQQPVAYAQVQQLTPDQVEQIRKSNKRKLVWGLICILGPTLLIVVTILVYALINFISSSSTSPVEPDDAFGGTTPIGVVIGNIVMFLIGGFSIITFVPGLIVGIILLVTRKKI